MHGHEKSDPFVVAVKPANKGRQLLAESVEPREGAEGNAIERGTRRTPNTQGGSPVREYRPPGSVRGAPGNRRPYLDTC